MKKIYTFATVLVTSITFAQNTSFEASEGFALGNIHDQNGWEVGTNSDKQIFNNQTVTNEKATDGNYSLKIAKDNGSNASWIPAVGASKTLTTSQNFNNLKLEFDVFITEAKGSSYDFGGWGIKDEDFVPVTFFSFMNSGELHVIKNVYFETESTGHTWEVNKWYKLKSEVNEKEIKYYVNNQLIFTGPNYAKSNLLGLNFLHDNRSGAAYIDNIKINDKNLATYEATVSKSLKVHPNPAKDVVTITSDEKITAFTIYNSIGQKVKSGTSTQDIDIKSLSTGNYILQAKSENGKTLSTKLIKN